MPLVNPATVGALTLAAFLLAGTMGAQALDLGQRLDGALDDTVDGMTVDWLSVPAARGDTTDGQLHTAQVTVTVKGGAQTIDLADLDLASTGRLVTLHDVQPVRDADGSVDEGQLTADDLVHIDIRFANPLEPGSTVTITFADGHKIPIDLQLTVPGHLPTEGTVELTAQTSW